jgi:hypothetical protein
MLQDHGVRTRFAGSFDPAKGVVHIVPPSPNVFCLSKRAAFSIPVPHSLSPAGYLKRWFGMQVPRD